MGCFNTMILVLIFISILLLFLTVSKICNTISGKEVEQKLRSERLALQSKENDINIRAKNLDKERDRIFADAEKKISHETLKLHNSIFDKEAELKKLSYSLDQRSASLDEREEHINDEIRSRTVEFARNISHRSYLSCSPAFRSIQNRDEAFYNRLLSALDNSMVLSAPFDISSNVVSSSGNTYHTTLYTCDCPDFVHRSSPCKHMLHLAVEVGFLMSFSNYNVEKDLNIKRIMKERDDLLSEISQLQHKSNRLREDSSSLESFISQSKESVQSQPWLAQLYADYQQATEGYLISSLRSKSHPAYSTAAKLESIVRGELRSLRIKAKEEEYQRVFYENMFPWLLDFKEASTYEAVNYVSNLDDADEDSKDYVRSGYLSHEEYTKLSESQRNQLALDRYIRSEKSPWQVGIEYERYIGYLCEKKGYSVGYNGAIFGYEDMGRDLILFKNNTVVLVQCKRWAKEKVIHENHVFQLAGSVFEYRHSHPDKEVIGAFVTTIDFSPIASECGELLGLHLYPNTPFSDYPRIKCNISSDGEKIYHLPMDQQYDRILIDKPGEFYAWSVEEAESAGFRRAYRWHSNND